MLRTNIFDNGTNKQVTSVQLPNHAFNRCEQYRSTFSNRTSIFIQSESPWISWQSLFRESLMSRRICPHRSLALIIWDYFHVVLRVIKLPSDNGAAEN